MSARILHLSDLHFRPGDPDDRDSSGRALLRAVAELAAAGAPPGLVLVSGDLVQEGEAAAYPVVGRFFDRLREAAGLPRDRILCVPGNHDVDRARGRRLQRAPSSAEDARLFFDDPEERALHRRKLQAYIDFVEGYGGGAERPLAQVQLGALRVGVGLLWSAWFSQGDDDRGQLFVGAHTVAAAATALQHCDLTIALCHHGPDWLHPLERAAAEQALAGFDLVCHGHLHGGPPDHAGTALVGRPVLAAGALHRRAQRPSRAFLIDADAGEDGVALQIRPLHHVRGAERWEADDGPTGPTGIGRFGEGPAPLPPRLDPAPPPPAAGDAPRTPPRAAASPAPGSVSRPPGSVARPPSRAAAERDEEARRRYLAALVAAADTQPAAVRHPAKEEPLLLRQLYLELPALLEGEAEPAPAHALLREAHLALVGPPGAGKSATLRHVGSELARRHLGMPSEAEGWSLGEGPPLPVRLGLDEVAAARPRPADLLAAIDTDAARHAQPLPAGFAGRALLCGPALLLCDGLEDAPAARRPALLGALLELLREHPQARLLLGLRPGSEAALRRASAAGPVRPRLAALCPLRLPERLRLIDRFVQVTSAIPVGMTIFGGAATLDAALRRAAGSAGAAALCESPLLLTALCWVAARYGLPPQRAELFSHCLGALVENRLRPDPDAVGAYLDELAESSEALRSFRTAQALAERPDPWDAVRPQLDEPSSHEALCFVGGLLARRSHEVAGRLLRAVLSEAGGRRSAQERALLVALAARLRAEMGSYEPDEKLGQRVQEELGRLLAELEDRHQRAPLPTRIAIAEGLGRGGDPRLPLDLLEAGPAGARLWVELPAGGGHRAIGVMRYPLTCAQLWQLVRLSGYEPRPEGPGRPVVTLWRERAEERPNHPATLLSWDDALFLCRFLTQADWRYRYDLPAESEWERAVRQGAPDSRFYPWGGTMEPGFCNTGRRVGKTTPVGVFPAGTAAGGAGCVDLIGNVWQWCQSEYDEDPTMIDTGLGDDGPGPIELPLLPQRVARGGSFAYLKTGVMRGTFPGTRSEEIGVRLVRRGK